MDFDDPHMVQCANQVLEDIYENYGYLEDESTSEILLYALNSVTREGRWVEVTQKGQSYYPIRKQDCPFLGGFTCEADSSACRGLLERIEGFVRCGEKPGCKLTCVIN